MNAFSWSASLTLKNLGRSNDYNVLGGTLEPKNVKASAIRSLTRVAG
jgi:hypothetical protein